MTYKYDEWYTNECEYIQMTYEWYMSDMRMAYDYIINDIQVHTIDTRVAWKWYLGDIGVTCSLIQKTSDIRMTCKIICR